MGHSLFVHVDFGWPVHVACRTAARPSKPRLCLALARGPSGGGGRGGQRQPWASGRGLICHKHMLPRNDAPGRHRWGAGVTAASGKACHGLTRRDRGWRTERHVRPPKAGPLMTGVLYGRQGFCMTGDWQSGGGACRRVLTFSLRVWISFFGSRFCSRDPSRGSPIVGGGWHPIAAAAAGERWRPRRQPRNSCTAHALASLFSSMMVSRLRGRLPIRRWLLPPLQRRRQLPGPLVGQWYNHRLTARWGRGGATVAAP